MRKKLFILLFYHLLFTCYSYGQIKDLDSLGNIWIITIDKSGSMLWNSQHQYTFANRIPIGNSVARRLTEKPILDKANYAKDRFIFFNSGILNVVDLNQLKLQSRFDTSFIHHTDTKLHSFKSHEDLVVQIKNQLQRGDYVYTYSLVSQIRLFSIIKGLDFIKSKSLTDNFNQLYLITITDDADQNDQWMNDYKTVKKFAPKKINDVNELTTKYLYNPFNAKSDISKSGTFVEKFIDDSEIPHINFYEYKTTQSATEFADSNAFINFKVIEDFSVRLMIEKRHYRSDSILFYYIELIVIDDSIYSINQYLTDTINISVKIRNWLNYNNISVNGYFQVQYTDSILGMHFKKYQFNQSATIPSAYLLNFEKKALATTVILILLLIAYIIAFSPRKKLFVIYDNFGRKYTGRKGSWFFGHYRYWEKTENTILSFVLHDENSYNFISKKHKNIIIGKHNFIFNEKRILIVSTSQLSIDKHITELTTAIDIEEHHQATRYNPILESVYHRSIQFQLFRIANKFKIKNSKFFSVVLYLSNLLFKHYYYLIRLSESDFKDTSVSFSCKSFNDRTFTIEFDKIKSENLKDENTIRNIACLNDFFSNDKIYADGLITIHVSDNHINWNVLKLEYQNSLRKVYHVFHFKQKFQNSNTLSAETIKENIFILRKLSLNSSIKFVNVSAYLTLCDKSSIEIQSSNSFKVLKVTSLDKINKNSFSMIKSVFQNFLNLIETKDSDKRLTKQLFSPFKNGQQLEMIPKSPVGDYHLYSCFAPKFVEKDFKEEYSVKISDNIFSFTTSRDLKLTFDSDKKQLHYANHTININDF